MLSRHRIRIIIVQALYQHYLIGRDVSEITAFGWLNRHLEAEEVRLCSRIIEGVAENRAEYDLRLADISHNWKPERIDLLSHIILHMSFWCLEHEQDFMPPAVVISEAIELAEQFVGSKTNAFINGILDQYRLKFAS